jgi:TatD DNase family protein
VTRLLDTHCHVDAYDDPRQTLADAASAGVDVVAVTESPEGYRRLRTRLGSRPGVTVALGLHPASAAAAAPGQLDRFFRMLPSADWIGEVGLDFAPGMGRAERSRQISLFQAVLDHDLTHGRPMTVHSRGAAKDTVTLLAQSRRRAVLHWYSGPLAVADEAVAAGLWFSVNPTMARSQKGLALLPRLPLGRVLCETDGPYCKVGNRPAVPADVDIVVDALARSWGATQDDVRAQLARNASALMGAPA